MDRKLPETWRVPAFIAMLQTPEATKLEWWPGMHDLDRFYSMVERLFGIKKDDFPRNGPQSSLNLKQYLEMPRVEERNRKEMARLIRAGTVSVRPEHNTAFALELLDPDRYGEEFERSSTGASGGVDMPKARSGGGEERKPKREIVHLRVDRERAASLLQNCLDEMKEHYIPDLAMNHFAPGIRAKAQTWTDKCEAVLKLIFGEGQTVDDFCDAGTPFYSADDFVHRYKKLLGVQASLPYIEQANPIAAVPKAPNYSTTKVFIVHGHAPLRHEVELFLTKIGLTPIILEEQASKGMTVIEKLEHCADVGFAVVLLTPDDVGGKLAEDPTKQALKPRARQNVILELGYFVGKLGRDRVCALKKGELEEPGDFENVVYVSYDDGKWGIKLVKELEAAGMTVNRGGM